MAFHVRAVNTAVDSENKIHDDAVAAAYGFRGGLVPGVTVYGYLAAAVHQHFGNDWLERGAMDVRFQKPVYDGDDVAVVVRPDGDGRVCVAAGECATGVAWVHQEDVTTLSDDAPVLRKIASVESLAVGTVLGTWTERLDLAKSGISAPLDPALDGRAHPAVMLGLANRILVENYELGPWMHVASEVRKFGSAKDGDEIRVRARVEDRYEKKGHEFVVLDVAIFNGERTIERVRHTAIWRPRLAA
jgi:acyl dehydratase